MSWGRTVTVTSRKLSDQERARLEKLNLQVGEWAPLFKLRCDHIDSNGKGCTLRTEGNHEYVTRIALTHTHETIRLEDRVRWGTLTGVSRIRFVFTESW